MLILDTLGDTYTIHSGECRWKKGSLCSSNQLNSPWQKVVAR